MKKIGCTYIIIPSLGRESLSQVCKDIIGDARGFDIKIIVITDGRQAARKVAEIMFVDDRILIVNNRFKPGISGAINTGLELVPGGGQLMFFSDDDNWLPGKIVTSLNGYQEHSNSCLIFQVKTHPINGKSSIKPEYLPKVSIEPFKYLYAKPQLIKNRRYFSLTSFIGPSEVAKIYFREDLDFREDIEWMNRVSKNGFSLYLTGGVTAEVEIGYTRTVERESITQLKTFLSILREESPKIEYMYIGWFFLRPYVVTGRVNYGMKILVQGKFLKRITRRKESLGVLFLFILGTVVKVRIWASYSLFPQARN